MLQKERGQDKILVCYTKCYPGGHCLSWVKLIYPGKEKKNKSLFKHTGKEVIREHPLKGEKEEEIPNN